MRTLNCGVRGLVLVLAAMSVGCRPKAHLAADVPSSVESMVFLRRHLLTGLFDGYTISDQADITAVWQALREDGEHLDENYKAGLSMSVNHVLQLRDSNGEIVRAFDILGDEYVVIDGHRYYSRNVMAAVTDIIDAGRAKLLPTDTIREMGYRPLVRETGYAPPHEGGHEGR